MIRGFVAGVIWGGVVAAAGLAVMSQVAPLPQPRAVPPVGEALPDGAAGGDAPVVVPQDPPAAPEPVEMPEILQKGPAPVAEGPAGEGATVSEAAPAPVAEADPAEAPEATADATAPDPTADAMAPDATVPVVTPEMAGQAADIAVETPEIAPVAPPTDAPLAPDLPDLAGGDTPAPAMPDGPQVAPAPAAPPVPMAEAAPAPQQAPPPVEAPREEALLTPTPAPEATPPALVTPQEPQADAPVAGATLPTEGTLEDRVAGVTTDRLPRIGDAPPAPEEMPAEAVPEVALPEAEEEVLAGTTPLDLFARPFVNAEGKPLFALLLIDEGADAALRAEVAKLPFPVTFVLDPLRSDSAAVATAYRAAGQEVAMLATGLPEGATAMDMEQSFQALDMALPEAVAVVDAPEGGFQDSLDLARQAVPILADQGRGLVTYDRGLNPADQVARREGVPRAVIFRVLDSEGESVPKMRNYLDRAAFKAAQEGAVVVIGRLRPDTLAAILEWSVEGRGASVALAPVSAVLDRPASN